MTRLFRVRLSASSLANMRTPCLDDRWSFRWRRSGSNEEVDGWMGRDRTRHKLVWGRPSQHLLPTASSLERTL